MKKGRSLELLVEKLEQHLSAETNVIIESPKKIKDSQTGKLREHDVVLTYSQSHHDLVVAIECKDRSRPIGVPEIEAFENKCHHTKINQGCIVSSSGFCKTALEKAKSMGIKCLELKEIENTSFLMPDASVYVHTKKYLSITYTPMAEENIELQVADNYDIYDSENNLITNEVLINNIKHVDKYLPLGELGKENAEYIYFNANNYYVITNKKKIKHMIKGILLKIKYVYERTESSFTSRSYSTASQNNLIAEIATAPLTLDGEERELTIIGKGDGSRHQFIS